MDRGMWQDEVPVLSFMSLIDAVPTVSPFDALTTPTRRLLGPWFVLAEWSGHPVRFLQLLFGLTWLGTALAARFIARSLAPETQLSGYLAGALTLCATSDFLTNSLAAIGYQMAIFTVVAAAACAIAWRRTARLGYLAFSTAFLVVSMWTVDTGLSALPLIPALLWLVPAKSPEEKPPGPIVPLLSIWAAAMIPYFLVLASEIKKPQSYYAAATRDLAWTQRILESFKLWIGNFTPWEWFSDRPLWFSTLPFPQPIPAWLMIALTILGTTVFAWGLYREFPLPSALHRPLVRTVAVVLVFLGMSFLANAMFAGVQLAHLHYRTHLLSRVWVALALAIAVGVIARRWRSALLIPVAFVALGIVGGLERQGYFLASWREHQRELASILDVAPAVRADTQMVLWVPPHPRYMATTMHYAQAWLALLYHDPSLRQAVLWSPGIGTGCRAEADGLRCWDPGQAACVEAGTCPGRRVPYDRLLALGFDVESGTYRLLQELPTDPPSAPAEYRPERRLIRRPLAEYQRRLLLLDHHFLARWLP